MKISIELNDDGELTIDAGEDDIDVVQINALLDIAKLNLVTSLMRGIVEESTTPEDGGDEIPV